MRRFLIPKIFSDLIIKFDDGTEVYGHQTVLIQWSKILRKMLMSNAIEYGAVFKQEKVVKMNHVENGIEYAGTFKEDKVILLSHKESDIKPSIVMLFVEMIYNLPRDMNNITMANIFEILDLSEYYECQNIKKMCLLKLDKQLKAVKVGDKSKKLPQTKPFLFKLLSNLSKYLPGEELLRNILVLAVQKLPDLFNTYSVIPIQWFNDLDLPTMLFIISTKTNTPEFKEPFFCFSLSWGIHYSIFHENWKEEDRLKFIQMMVELITNDSKLELPSTMLELIEGEHKKLISNPIVNKSHMDFMAVVQSNFEKILLRKFIEKNNTNTSTKLSVHVDLFKNWSTWYPSKRPNEETEPKQSKTKKQKTNVTP